MEHPHVYVSELHAVQALLPKSGNGVEIGIGTGRFAAPLGIKRGIEPSKAMAGFARKKGLDVVPGVAEKLPYQDSEFDFCLMVTTICFLDDIDLAFKEIHRVLRNGGSFIIGFVDRNSPLGIVYTERKNTSAFYKDATFYSTDELVSYMKQAGFADFSFSQTIFQPLDEIQEAEPVKEGHGEGSFVVVRGIKV